MPAASGDHPIETPVRRTLLKLGTTTATYSPQLSCLHPYRFPALPPRRGQSAPSAYLTQHRIQPPLQALQGLRKDSQKGSNEPLRRATLNVIEQDGRVLMEVPVVCGRWVESDA